MATVREDVVEISWDVDASPLSDLMKMMNGMKESATGGFSEVEDGFSSGLKSSRKMSESVSGLADDFGNMGDEAKSRLQGAAAGLSEVAQGADASKTHLSETEDALKGVADVSVSQVAGEVGEIGEQAESSRGKVDGLVSSMGLESWLEKQEALLTRAQELYDSNVSSIVNSFNQIPEQYQMSAEQMLEAVKKNTEQMLAYQKNLADLSGMDGLSEAAIREIEKIGPAANSVLEEIKAGGPAAVAEWNAAFAGVSEVASDMTLNSGELAASAREAGFESADAFVVAFDTRMGAVEAGLENIRLPELDTAGIEASLDVVTTSMGSMDAATTEATAGMETSMENLSVATASTQTAMSGEMDTIVGNVERMSSSIRSVLDSLADALYTSGVNAMQGFNNGMESMRESIVATARSIGRAATQAMRAELDEHSPSKVTEEIGRFAGQGFSLGVGKEEPAVRREAEILALASVPDVGRGPLVAERRPETSPSVVSRGGAQVVNHNNPQFSLTVGSAAGASDRDLERKVRRWVRESFEQVLAGAERNSPAAREA